MTSSSMGNCVVPTRDNGIECQTDVQRALERAAGDGGYLAFEFWIDAAEDSRNSLSRGRAISTLHPLLRYSEGSRFAEGHLMRCGYAIGARELAVGNATRTIFDRISRPDMMLAFSMTMWTCQYGVQP
jgi:hypothetical protein